MLWIDQYENCNTNQMSYIVVMKSMMGFFRRKIMKKPIQKGKIGNKNACKDDKNDTGYAGRCKMYDKNTWINAAQKEGLNLNKWTIKHLNAAAKEISGNTIPSNPAINEKNKID
ncbi:hypothetical protein [Photorhabdus luminescens]|uniref:hypothetical protein n=1 Tax=Photorhabdus luminescens TaxID=29488 RepID=UPI00223EA270|nr:hypothetical protein [Photorhabdus luminescens]MCW7763397.1 hypothetical protein [Photorhabdus luminescens subsp. venezuelensis]